MLTTPTEMTLEEASGDTIAQLLHLFLHRTVRHIILIIVKFIQ